MSDQEEEPTEDAKKEAEEAEIVSGLLTFHVGDREVTVPELKWRDDRAWQKKYLETQVRLSQPASPDPLSEDGVQALEDAELELVLAYDQTHALGDLEDATRRQIRAIYDRLVEVSWLPLADSLTTLMLVTVRQAVQTALENERSRADNSTSSPSPTGTSPVPLRRPTPTARSSSSTRKRKSA